MALIIHKLIKQQKSYHDSCFPVPPHDFFFFSREPNRKKALKERPYKYFIVQIKKQNTGKRNNEWDLST